MKDAINLKFMYLHLNFKTMRNNNISGPYKDNFDMHFDQDMSLIKLNEM